jgi:ribose 5-phosphate isomerase B
MKIIIGSDHAGFEAKEEIKKFLNKHNINFEDIGPFSTESVDYPDFAKKVCCEILKNNNNIGILICGSGTGMQIAANKIKGIRAAFCYDKYSAKMAKLDNDANVLTLRAREFNHNLYGEIILTFINTKFSELDRHKKRIEKIKEIENSKIQCK